MGYGTLSVALCHVVPKNIVICANVRDTGYVVIIGLVTDYLNAIALTPSLSFFLSL